MRINCHVERDLFYITSSSSLSAIFSTAGLNGRNLCVVHLRPVRQGHGFGRSMRRDPCTERNRVFFGKYGTPLQDFAQLAIPTLRTVGTNTLIHQRALANSSAKAVVRPNADTLYTVLIYDLSAANLAITVPPVDSGRYYAFSFYDPYGDDYANIGSVNNSSPGKYLLRIISEASAQLDLALATDSGDYVGHIDSPTTYGILLARILVRGDEDVPAVNRIQNATAVAPVPRLPSPPSTHAPSLTLATLTSDLSNDTLEATLQLTARLARWNLPEVPSDHQRVACNLLAAGISNGTYTQPPGVSLAEADLAARALQAARIAQPSTVVDLGNGWQALDPVLCGNFGTNYDIRAYVADTGYLQLQASEAIYPFLTISSGPLNLGPHEAYLFTFSSRPPVEGFWSLTAYGPDIFFIPNPMDVYALGDRSNITYADGSLVYGNSSPASDDGPFQLLVQPADVTPPANWTANWLPIQAGGGTFSLTLRWYGPTTALSDGSYVYPEVVKGIALTA